VYCKKHTNHYQK